MPDTCFPKRATIVQSKLLQRYELIGPVGRAALSALVDKFDAWFGIVAPHELPEAAAFFGIADNGRPFALVCVDEVLCHRFELSGDCELVSYDDVAHMIDAA